MNAPVWKLDRVTLAAARRPRLDNVSLDIGTGHHGDPGAFRGGKTSLLNLLVGFERPDRGNDRRRPLTDPETGCRCSGLRRTMACGRI